MLGKPKIAVGVFTVLRAVFPAKIGTVFVDHALVLRTQEIAPCVDHDIPALAVYIYRDLVVRDFPQQAFVILTVFRLVDLEGEVITTVGRQAFFTLAGIVSSVFTHGIFLKVVMVPIINNQEGCILYP